MKNKFLILLNILALVSCISLSIKFVALPLAAKKLYSDRYKKLMFSCDNVMRDHLIAKNRVIFEKSNKSIKKLEAAEIALTSCHEYDLIRKKMLIWGVSEYELQYLGLEAIEENAKDLVNYVESHEFRY